MASKPPIVRKPARPDLPTMYDLPSEDPKEPGLPDDFHYLQPQLLRETFHPSTYPPERVYVGTDINLYFDPDHPLWPKRPDWFAVLDVASPREQLELRLSYVIWQEQVAPYLVVELLSPGTEREDMGRTVRVADEPPNKWEVYERILEVPYYAIFSRYRRELQLFRLIGGRYRQQELTDNRYWFPDLGLGLGLWTGRYQDVQGIWLRCYDDGGAWILTAAERQQQLEQRAEQERQRAEQERRRAEQERRRADSSQQRAERLAARLRALGIDPDNDAG